MTISANWRSPVPAPPALLVLLAILLAAPGPLPGQTPRLYAVDAGTGEIAVFDPEDGTPLPAIAVADSPAHGALGPGGRTLYLPDRASDSVQLVDLVTGNIDAVITDPSIREPMAVALTPNGRQLWVLNRSGGPAGDGSISIIDLAARAVSDTVDLPALSFPEHLVISPSGQTAYISNTAAETVIALLTFTRQTLLTLPMGGGPVHAVITPGGSDVFVSVPDLPAVVRIHTDDHSLTEFPTPDTPSVLAYRDGALYVPLGDQRVGVLTPPSRRLRTINFPDRTISTFSVALVDGSSLGFVSDTATGRVFGFDAVTLRPRSGPGLPLEGLGEPRQLLAFGRVNRSDLGLSLRADEATVPNGGELENIVTVTNAGPSTATEVFLEVELSVGMEVVEVTATRGECQVSPGRVECRLGELAQGGRITVRLDLRPGSEGVNTNFARVSAAQPDPDPSDNSAGVSTFVEPATDLAVTVDSVPDPVAVGQVLTYQVRVRNQGQSVADDIRLDLHFPFALTFVSVQPPIAACGDREQSFRCELSHLDPQQTLLLLVQAVPRQAGLFVLLASAFTSTADPDESNNILQHPTRVIATPNVADLKFSLVPDRLLAAPSDGVVLQADIRNQGPDTAFSVSSVVGFPRSLIFVEPFHTPDIACEAVGALVECRFGDIPAAGLRTVFLRARLAPDAHGLVKTWGLVSGVGADPREADNLSRAEVLVAGGADFNRDGVVDAGDLQLLILELTDGDGEAAADAAGGSFGGSAAMDLDSNGRIDFEDARIVARYAFANSGEVARASLPVIPK